MIEGSIWGSLLVVLAPVLKALFEAIGRTANDRAAQQQADRNSQELGRAKAEADAANRTIEAQQRELQAQQDAPVTVNDAVRRLEEGSA